MRISFWPPKSPLKVTQGFILHDTDPWMYGVIVEIGNMIFFLFLLLFVYIEDYSRRIGNKESYV